VFLLSGFVTHLTGSPGIWQAHQLNLLLTEQRQKLQDVETESVRLDALITNMNTNMEFQEREVRRVLGYVASNEIVFDFSPRKPY